MYKPDDLNEEMLLVRTRGSMYADPSYRPRWMTSAQWKAAVAWLNGLEPLTDPKLLAGVRGAKKEESGTPAAKWAYTAIPSYLVDFPDEWNALILEQMDIGL